MSTGHAEILQILPFKFCFLKLSHIINFVSKKAHTRAQLNKTFFFLSHSLPLCHLYFSLYFFFCSLINHFLLCSIPHCDCYHDFGTLPPMNSYLIWFPQCQWVYRAFEDVEERDRGAGEKEESPFRPYPVENGSDHEEENGTNGTGKTNPLKFSQC